MHRSHGFLNLAEEIVAALNEQGLEVRSIQEVRGLAGKARKKAASLLAPWLARTNDPVLKEELVYAIGVREAGPEVGRLLIAEFNRPSADTSTQLRWSIGNAIEMAACAELTADMIRIARDTQAGIARQMVVLGMARLPLSEVEDTLLLLLDQPEVQGHALTALRKLKSIRAREHVRHFLDDDRAWIRNQARAILGEKPPVKASRAKAPAKAAAPPWYRRVSWSPEDAADFEAHLARARAPNRAQYLCVQAAHLKQTKVPSLVRVALSLVLRAEALVSSSDVLLANALDQRAECLADLGRLDQAIDAHREALGLRRRSGVVPTLAQVPFAELVGHARRVDLVPEALSALSECRLPMPMPAFIYRLEAARAVLLDMKGDEEGARESARVALAAAAVTTPPLARHPEFGLVRHQDPATEARLRRLAAGALPA